MTKYIKFHGNLSHVSTVNDTNTHRRKEATRIQSFMHKRNENSIQTHDNTKEHSSLSVCHATSLSKYFPTFRRRVQSSSLEKSGLRISPLTGDTDDENITILIPMKSLQL
jgi:hypothetical protein